MALFDDELRRLQQIKAQNDTMAAADAAQQDYSARMAQAQNDLTKAQSKSFNPLESVLGGIANSIATAGKGLGDFFTTGAINAYAGTGLKSLLEGKSYAQAAREARQDTDDFKKRYYNTDNLKDAYAKSGGTALDTAATLSDLIPGLGTGAKVALNVGQGAASGIANNYMNNGADVSLEDNLKGALVGGLSSAAGQAAGGALGKVSGNSAISKAARSTLGRGALTGAASGAVGGGLAAALNGGDLGQVIGGGFQGAGQGALGGATMAGAMSLASKGINRVSDKLAGNRTVQDVDIKPVAEVEEVKPLARIDEVDVTEAPKAKVQLDPVEEAKLDRKYTVAKQKQGQALMAQYGSIDAPTARSVGDAEGVLTRLYDNYGLETPADVAYAAKKLTGNDGIVTKMTRKLASSAGDISSTYPEAELDQLIIESGLGLDSTRGKALKQQIASIISSTRQSSSPDMANANDVLDMVKKLERKSADVAGKSGNNYHRATYEDLAAASVINTVASDYKDRIWNGAQDISTVLTPETINDLKSVFPKNKKFQSGVDNIISQAKNGQELRHTMADLVNGSKISDNSKMIAGTVGAQMVKAATSANPVVAATQMIATKALDSDAANKIRANRYAKQAAKAQAKLTGEAPTTLGTGKSAVKDALANVGGVAKNALDAVNAELPSGDWQSGNSLMQTLRNANIMAPSDVKSLPALNATSLASALTGANNLLNNQNVLTREVSRQAGLSAARNQESEAEQQAIKQDMQNIQNDYDGAITQAQQAYTNAQTMAPAANTDTGRLDQITRAMDLALAAGDLDSYSKLASLYQTAYKIYAPAAETASSASSLNATQQGNLAKLESAGTAINQLEQLYNQAGGAQGRLGGSLAQFGGALGINSGASAYENAARGLINQIAAAVGKTDSLNTEGEVQRALDLAPKITDTPEEAQTKLQSLRNMLNANKQTYQSIYGITQ